MSTARENTHSGTVARPDSQSSRECSSTCRRSRSAAGLPAMSAARRSTVTRSSRSMASRATQASCLFFRRAATVPAIKLATFNVNGLRQRLAHLLLWLEREAPDIACLQELKGVDAAFPAAELKRAGYGALWHEQRSWNGVAILARGAE